MGIDFLGFLILLIIALVVALVLHFGLKFYVTEGLTSFFGKLIIAWLGAWFGSPVFGHWFEGLNYNEIYIIPAILGSLALVVLAVDLVQTFKD